MKESEKRRIWREKLTSERGSGIGTFFSTLLLVIAIGVFCFAAYKLIGYYLDYKVGTDEYSKLKQAYVLDPQDTPRTDAPSEDETAGQEAEGTSAPVSRGIVLQNVEELEDPQTVQEKIAQAAEEETVENGEIKTLPLLRNPIDFSSLNQINDEIIGWIRIGALDVSYPVAQAADNDFYLHRTFEKQDNFAGCIFLNCDNSKYFTDQNSIVYGHNMKNGSMFGTLKKYREQETYDANPYFWIFTPTLIYQYRIFATAEVSTVGDPYRVRFTKDDFRAFLENMTTHSIVDTHGVRVSTDDRIVTLSTCTGNTATRFIVQGKLEQMYIAK